MFLVPGSSPSTLSAVIHIDIQDRRLPEASDASYRLSSLSEKESKASWGKMQRLQSQLYCPTLDKTLTVPTSVSSTVTWETQYGFCFVSSRESTLNTAELCVHLSTSGHYSITGLTRKQEPASSSPL